LSGLTQNHLIPYQKKPLNRRTDITICKLQKFCLFPLLLSKPHQQVITNPTHCIVSRLLLLVDPKRVKQWSTRIKENIFRLFDIWYDKDITKKKVIQGIGYFYDPYDFTGGGNRLHINYPDSGVVLSDNFSQVMKVTNYQKLRKDLPFALTDSARQKCRERSHQFKTVQAPKRHQIVKTLNE